MDDNKKSIEDLAKDFTQQWDKTSLPNMEPEELLDLMDYYSRAGMDFEAELCRYIANKRYPDNPEVVLTQAHTYADEGNWLMAAVTRHEAGITGYDDKLFEVEHSLRLGMVTHAMDLMVEALPIDHEFDLADYDFIFDTAVLFHDYGYCSEAIKMFEQLPPSYVDYVASLHLRVECHIVLQQFGLAKKILNEMLDHASFDQALWTRMANCCFEQGAYDEAIEACEYALAIGDDDEAQHIRLMANVRKNEGRPNSELFREAMQQQDYRSCLEYADTLYEKGEYDEALQAYGFSNLFCPQGSRDQEHILANSIICLAHNAACNSATIHLRALLTRLNDCWDTLHEVAQIFFEKGDTDNAIHFLNMANDAHLIYGMRYNQLIALLAHYACYEKARHFWEDIILHDKMVLESYKPMLTKACMELGLT